MGALYVAAVVGCFWEVLGREVVFIAPDAPIDPVGWLEGWRRFFALPTLHGFITAALPYWLAYEGTFWVDGFVMCLAGLFWGRGRGASWGAAWTGGFCAAFAGYFFTLFCAGHRGVVDALAVSCLGFGALVRMVAAGRWRFGGVLGAVLALGLGAQADIWLLVVCALGAYGLFLVASAWGQRRVLWWRWGAGLALAVGVFLALGSPALRHTFGAAWETRSAQVAAATAGAEDAQAAREARWSFVTGWSLPPEELAEWLWPGCFGHTSYAFDPKPYRGRMGMPERGLRLRQHTIFLGWAALALAALAWGRRLEGPLRGERRFWTALALCAGVLALGRYTPLYRAIFCLPGLGAVRAPVKWLHLAGFAVAMLAGLGAEAVVKRWGAWAAAGMCAAVAACGAAVARPYVFARDLSANALVRAVPPGAQVWSALRWGEFEVQCRWHGVALAAEPEAAEVMVAPCAWVEGRPAVATLQVEGMEIGLYRVKSEVRRTRNERLPNVARPL